MRIVDLIDIALDHEIIRIYCPHSDTVLFEGCSDEISQHLLNKDIDSWDIEKILGERNLCINVSED